MLRRVTHLQQRIAPAQQRTASRGAVRHFHATQQQPFWLVAAGASCAALFLGSRYVVRTQERMRRKREGLPVDDDDDDSSDYQSPAARMTQILGLDFGTSNLRLAVAPLLSATASQRVVRVIESADGLRAIPAAVAVDNDSVSVGGFAKALLGRKPGYTGLATRLLLERDVTRPTDDEWRRLLAALPYSVTPTASGDAFTLELDGKSYSPEWAAEVLLDYVHAMAARSLSASAADGDHDGGFPVVLAVPAGLNATRRSAFERVAHSAGFAVVATVDEPIAALHAAELAAYTDDDVGDSTNTALLADGATIAVFDMGGFVSSLTLLQRCGVDVQVLATCASTDVAGERVDDALVSQITAAFSRSTGIDLQIDPMARFRVREAVEAAKCELATRRTTDVNLPFITADATGAKHLVHKLSAFDLARASEASSAAAVALCDQALAAAGCKSQDVDALVLVGGGVRSKPMRETLERYFSRTAFSARNFRPDEAVVVGAAEYGRRLVTSE